MLRVIVTTVFLAPILSDTIKKQLSQSCDTQIETFPNSTSFSLLNCSYLVYDIQKSHVETTTNWKECTLHCCNPYKDYEMVMQSFNTCFADTSLTSFSKWIGISLAIVLVAVTAFMIYCCCCKSCRCCQNCRQNPQKQERQTPQSSKAIIREQQIDWQSDSVKKIQNCPICLEDDSDLQLPCKHMLHVKCWQEWYKFNKKSCVVCRMQAIRPVRIYCYTCLKLYFECLSQELIRTDLVRFTCIICQSK